MADPVYLILVVFHIACAATSFGITLPSGPSLRRAIGQSRDVKVAMHVAAMRAGRLSDIFGLLTFATGLALIFNRFGGFKNVPMTINAAMGLILVMIALGAFFMRPLGIKIGAAIDQGDDAWRASLKPFAMGNGIMSLLWFVILVLMFIKPS